MRTAFLIGKNTIKQLISNAYDSFLTLYGERFISSVKTISKG